MDNIVDTSTGAAGSLRVIVSTKTASIKGTAPVGHFVEAIGVSSPNPMRSGAMVDQQGSFIIGGLRPGKYQVVAHQSLNIKLPADGWFFIRPGERHPLKIYLKLIYWDCAQVTCML